MSRASRRRERATHGKPIGRPHRWAGLVALALAAAAVAILTVFILTEPPGQIEGPIPTTTVSSPTTSSATASSDAS